MHLTLEFVMKTIYCKCNNHDLFYIRLNTSQIVAVSIETAFQNGSIAFILLQLTLDDPKNDIATIAPIAQIMLTGNNFP